MNDMCRIHVDVTEIHSEEDAWADNLAINNALLELRRFYVQPEKKAAVMESMKDLLYVPFRFENGGTRVIYYSAEKYEPIK